MKRRILAVLCVVAVLALTLAATKSRYAMYQGINFAGATSQLFVPTYNGAAFIPGEMTITLSAAKGCSISVYLCDTLTTAGPSTATDSFYIPFPDVDVAGGIVVEYAGPMSDTMRFHATSNATNTTVHCFK